MSGPVRHHLLALHPVLAPAAVLFLAFLGLLSVTQEGDTRPMLIQMATGEAVLVSVWLLLRQYVGTLIMASQGFDKRFDQLHRDISEVRSLPAIQRALARQRNNGPEDTEPPVVAPKFNP